MPPITSTSSDRTLTMTVHPGDGAVLIGFSLDEAAIKTLKLAGFAIACTPPKGQPRLLVNRLAFPPGSGHASTATPVTSATTPATQQWTPSDQAPFQRFHWMHFPGDAGPGTYRYKVTARLFQGTTLVDGPSAEAAVSLVPPTGGRFALGFTRGYLTSQAYATQFKNAPYRPAGPKSIDYDTSPFQKQYQWLGYHARQLMFDIMQESVADTSISVDLFAYDFDEPDLIKLFEQMGPRLRAVLDNASLHTGQAAEVQTHARLVQSAGAANIKQGHFQRFAHDKIVIQRKNGTAVKVLTGSANFSVRGLYVQANNVMVFDDPQVAGLYDQVFESVFTNMSGFTKTPLAAKWFDFPSQPGVPPFSVSFAPHQNGSVSLNKVVDALKAAKSSVLFAVMELGGSGAVLSTLNELHLSGRVFSYGMTQAESGFKVYKPGEPGLLVPFSALDKHVPPPFTQEWRGGMGQVIHDKFVVIDFNDATPIVFTGSSNLAEGGESQNGDNLLAISDPVVASAFAVEAIRLVDHYHFRANAELATDVEPLALATADASPPWWASAYDPTDITCVQRELFALGPGGTKDVTPVARSGASSTPATTPTKPAQPASAPAPPARKGAKTAKPTAAKPRAKKKPSKSSQAARKPKAATRAKATKKKRKTAAATTRKKTAKRAGAKTRPASKKSAKKR